MTGIEKSSKNNNRILALLFTGVLMGALDISIVGPAIPSIDKALNVDERLLSWIFSIYILASLMGISLMARLSDKFGRKSIYTISVTIFGIGSLLAAVADNITLLLISRAIQGFGASGIFPVASAVIGDIFPPEKRGRALGLIGAVFGIAFIIGPVIAGVLLSFFSWNSLFLINLPIAIVLIFGSIKLLPGRIITINTTIDWKGIAFLGLMLVSFAFAINNIDAAGFPESLSSMLVWPFLIFSILMFILLFYAERKATMPVVKPSLFRAKQIRAVGFLALGTGLYQATFAFIPKLTVSAFSVEPSIASFMLLPVVFATALGSPISGRMIDKYGSRIVIIAALLLMTAGMSLLSLFELNKVLYYSSGVLLGFGLSVLAGSSLRYIMLNEVKAQERASTQGVLTIFISVGQIVGSAMIGALTASNQDVAKGFRLAFGLLVAISIILLLQAYRLKNKAEEEKSYQR